MKKLEKKLLIHSDEMARLREKNLVLESLLKISKEKIKDLSVSVESTSRKKARVVSKATEFNADRAMGESFFNESQTSSDLDLEDALGDSKRASNRGTRRNTESSKPFKQEHRLYGSAIEYFRKKDEQALDRVSEIFLKTYPESVHADNVLFLKGRLALDSGKLKLARKTLRKIEKKYRNGNKFVGALFLKAKSYSHEGRDKKASRYFKEVIKRFPGSQEAFRAKTELKLIGLKL